MILLDILLRHGIFLDCIHFIGLKMILFKLTILTIGPFKIGYFLDIYSHLQITHAD